MEQAAQDRRNDFDVTNRVQVSSPGAVRAAVSELFTGLYPHASFDSIWLAFHDFERLFGGQMPDYHAVDTTYHDMQHTLDMTLALARLVAGHEMSVAPRDRLGPKRAELAIVSALFHDAGYIRHKERDAAAVNGAEFTRQHVTRSGKYLEGYLPALGLGEFVPVVSPIVHFTGYELDIERIELDDPKDCTIGHLLGTADLIAQISDRCYLEKCRDRLYPEFVIGGIALEKTADGLTVRYGSARDLLAKTLGFYRYSARTRLERTFHRVYRYYETFFERGESPYAQFIRKNLAFLDTVLRGNAWDQLRRHPPCAVPDRDGEARLMALAHERLAEWSERAPARAVCAEEPVAGTAA